MSCAQYTHPTPGDSFEADWKFFKGTLAALSITTEEGKLKTTELQVSELTEIQLTDNLFTPSVDMKRVTDMHTGRSLQSGDCVFPLAPVGWLRA